MGLSSALEPARPVVRSAANPVAEFLQQLDGELPRLQAASLAAAKTSVESVVDDGAEQLERLAARLRELSAQALSHERAAIAEELEVCDRILSSAGTIGAFAGEDAAQLAESMARIAACVAADLDRERTPTSGPVAPVVGGSAQSSAERAADEGAQGSWDLDVAPTVLVVASEQLVDSLIRTSAPEDGEPAPRQPAGELEIQSVDDPARASDRTRALAPDLVVIDLDRGGARELVETLLDSPLTATIPIIGIGTWERPEQAASVVALGVHRTLAKPVSPDKLRRACLEVAANPATPAVEPIGETTLDELGARLAKELEHGLCHAADDETRSLPIDVGQGTEVLAALWGAIARIRELLAASSGGKVQFVPTGPERALPAASWLTTGHLRRGGERPGPLHEVRRVGEHALVGRTIVVADDDLSVNWFLSGVLRQAGARVLEARDGVSALEHAYRQAPDLIISDILMPGLDGFALCRALERDVLLRDVPVILLSWKDDLLQRVRELGVGAEGYLRKDASGAAIVRRVAEVIRARSEIFARIDAGGPVRGRLDGMTAHALLAMVCKLRPDCCLSVRDALFLYEVEIRSGQPVRATRTSADGRSIAGPPVMAALLGVGLGRFGIEDGSESVEVNLEGTLQEQLDHPVATARAALLLLSGPALLEVDEVVIDDAFVASYSASSPQAARHLLHAIASGECPRELLQSGRASSHMVETVLGDAARYGAVRQIRAAGADRLGPVAARELAIRGGDADEQDASDALRALIRSATHFEMAPQEPQPVAEDDGEPEAPVSARPEELLGEEAGVVSTVETDGVAPDRQDPATAEQEAPTAVGDRTPVLASQVAALASYERRRRERTSREEQLIAAERAARRPVGSVGTAPELSQPSNAPAPRAAAAPSAAHHEAASTVPQPEVAAYDVETVIEPLPAAATRRRVPMPSSFAPDSKPQRGGKPRGRFLWPLLFAVVGIGLAVGARWMRERPSAPPAAAPLPAALPTTSLAPAATQTPTPAPAPSESPAPATEDDDLPRVLPLAKGDEVAKGEGMLEIVAGKNDEIFVNGKRMGKGPVLKVTLKAVPDPYEVRVKLRGEERVRYAVVHEGKRVKLRVAPPWSR